tara:strand:+ start:387 stop:935 length:549 start_codon:yes stop_codon:yes gene_type:complete
MGLIDVFVAYQLVKFLTLDYTEFDAYKEGVIDEKGNILVKNKANRTPKQKKSFTKLHVVAFNLRKILEKIPLVKSKLGRFASALFLLKEEFEKEGRTLDVEKLLSEIDYEVELSESNQIDHLDIGFYIVDDYPEIGETAVRLDTIVESTGEMLGVSLFTVEDIEGNKLLVSADDLRKVSHEL